MNKKADERMTIGKLVTIILILIVVVLVIVGFSTGLFKPLVEKARDAYNGVLSLFGIEQPVVGASEKEITIFGEKKIMRFNEAKQQCEVDLGDKEIQGLKGKYAVRFNENDKKYELFHYINNNWENINGKIPTAEEVNLRSTKDALNNAIENLKLNFEGKDYKIDLTEFGLGIFYVQREGRNDISYHYQPQELSGGSAKLMKPLIGEDWLECDDNRFSDSEKQLCDDFHTSISNYKFLFLGEERTLSFKEIDGKLIIYTNIGGSLYGIGLNDYGKKELYVKYPTKEWSRKQDLTYTSSKENSYLYIEQEEAEKLLSYKQLKEVLERECENW